MFVKEHVHVLKILFHCYQLTNKGLVSQVKFSAGAENIDANRCNAAFRDII